MADMDLGMESEPPTTRLMGSVDEEEGVFEIRGVLHPSTYFPPCRTRPSPSNILVFLFRTMMGPTEPMWCMSKRREEAPLPFPCHVRHVAFSAGARRNVVWVFSPARFFKSVEVAGVGWCTWGGKTSSMPRGCYSCD
jgi:hypothetical protein